MYGVALENYLPGCDPSKGLHAEQYVELVSEKPPTEAEVVTNIEVCVLAHCSGCRF